MNVKRLSILLLAGVSAFAQESHHDAVDRRGDHVMGFSHEQATHHFLLFADGGAIEVTANGPKDTATRDQIRMHLGHIARMFAAGDFQAPMLIHDRVPPGVPVVQRLKSEVTWRYENIERGGRIRVSTQNKDALEAVHQFLRFQIDDHRTGDSGEIVTGAR